MIGIVVVSHSPRLAQAAVELALEMVHGDTPAIAIAAGAGAGITGTDAVKVSEAIARVSGPDGVLVMMDLGSAVLSAEMALEFVTNPDVEIRLTSAPFVEGLLAGVVSAAGGASLAAVEREAIGALAAKQSQLGDFPAAAPEVLETPDFSAEVTICNPDGVHARPAAMIIGALGGLDARVSMANRRTRKPAVSITGPTSLLTLGARTGDVLVVSTAGSQAAEALAAVTKLVAAGFGELEAAVPAIAVPGNTAPRGGPLGVSPGRAAGPILHLAEPLTKPAAQVALPAEARAAEAARIGVAAASVSAMLNDRASHLSGTAKHILEATAMMAVDPGFTGDAEALVTDRGEHAEHAVWATIDSLVEVFTGVGGRTAERIADLQDVRNRVVSELLGRPAPGVPSRVEPFVLVARDLAPADTAVLDPSLCRALVTAEGGPTSHTAILARSLGIPAIVAAPAALDLPEGSIVIVDGSLGEIITNPTAEQISSVSTDTAVDFDGTGRTADGHRVHLLANVGSPASVAEAVAARAEGVGLFRTEFCFLDRAEAPTVDEQVAAYRTVLGAFPGQKVIVRTLDAGADKPLSFVSTAYEQNPALGLRGFRTSWRKPGLLDDQLRAIAIAASAEKADVGVMAPMISTASEAAEFAVLCAAHGLDAVGVMIETPSAALTAEDLLAHVTFASLGTNDLTQYTMAADRLVGDLALLNDPWQPAVLRAIELACAAGQRVGKPVGVCGEAAADPLLATVLVGLGATSLSMSARALGRVAASLASATAEQCRAAAEVATAATDPAEARAAVRVVLGR